MKVLLFLLVANIVFAEWRLSFLIGDVEIEREERLLLSKLNMEIKSGDKITTKPNSYCEIKDGDDLIKIEENTEFVVSNIVENKDWFKIVVGKIFARIKRLSGKDFQLYTPTAVMGLRGTVFSVEVRNGITKIAVFRGEIEAFVKEKRFVIKKDELFKVDVKQPEDKQIEKRRMGYKDKEEFKERFREVEEEEKSQLKEEIRKIRQEIQDEKISILEVKRRDFSSGRTMRDRWGNITRVEQHLYLPDNYRIKFVNLNKRDSYQGDAPEFSYFSTEAKFNKELPDDVSKWHEWIAQEMDKDVKSDLHPEWVETVLANGRPQDDCDRMKWTSEWDSSKNELKEPHFFIDKGGDVEGYKEYSKDWRDTNYQFPDSGYLEDEKIKIINDLNGNEAGKLKIRTWLINNDGRRLTESELKSMDLWKAVKETGFELRIENYENNLIINKPIDIIFTLDIVIAGIKELAGYVAGEIVGKNR